MAASWSETWVWIINRTLRYSFDSRTNINYKLNINFNLNTNTHTRHTYTNKTKEPAACASCLVFSSHSDDNGTYILWQHYHTAQAWKAAYFASKKAVILCMFSSSRRLQLAACSCCCCGRSGEWWAGGGTQRPWFWHLGRPFMQQATAQVNERVLNTWARWYNRKQIGEALAFK